MQFLMGADLIAVDRNELELESRTRWSALNCSKLEQRAAAQKIFHGSFASPKFRCIGSLKLEEIRGHALAPGQYLLI